MRNVSNNGAPVHDAILFESLKLCLDEADKTMMQRMKEQDRGITFANFFAHLRRLYASDPSIQNRRAWEALKLEHPQIHATLAHWNVYKENYLLLRNRVEDRNEGEEYKLLMEQFPLEWKRLIVLEENKRKKNQWVIRLSNLPPRTSDRLQAEVEACIGGRVIAVEASGNGMHVTCGSAESAQRGLDLTGSTLGGRQIRTTKRENRLCGDDIIDFISDRMEAEERVQGLTSISQNLPSLTWGTIAEVRETEVVEKRDYHRRGHSRTPPQSPRQGDLHNGMLEM